MGEPIPQNGWIVFSLFLYFNFKNLKDPNSLSFITFQYTLHDLAVHFSVFQNFLKLKRVDLIFRGKTILHNSWATCSCILYFNFKNLKQPNSLSFFRFQWTLHDSAILFSVFWNFFKLKWDDLTYWGEPIPQNSRIIWSPFCVSILVTRQ